MLEQYRVLGAMAALREFTVADVEKYSGVKSQTVHSVLARNESLVEVIGRVDTQKPGNTFNKYRIRAQRFEALRKEIREAFQAFMSGPEQPARSSASPRNTIPLEFLVAEDIYIRRWPKAHTRDERVALLSLADAAFSSKTDASVEDPNSISQKYLRYLRALKEFCSAEISPTFSNLNQEQLHLARVREELTSAIEGYGILGEMKPA